MKQKLYKLFAKWLKVGEHLKKKRQDKHCGFHVKTEITVFSWKSNFPKTFTCVTTILRLKMNGLLSPHFHRDIGLVLQSPSCE